MDWPAPPLQPSFSQEDLDLLLAGAAGQERAQAVLNDEERNEIERYRRDCWETIAGQPAHDELHFADAADCETWYPDPTSPNNPVIHIAGRTLKWRRTSVDGQAYYLPTGMHWLAGPGYFRVRGADGRKHHISVPLDAAGYHDYAFWLAWFELLDSWLPE